MARKKSRPHPAVAVCRADVACRLDIGAPIAACLARTAVTAPAAGGLFEFTNPEHLAAQRTLAAGPPGHDRRLLSGRETAHVLSYAIWRPITKTSRPLEARCANREGAAETGNPLFPHWERAKSR